MHDTYGGFIDAFVLDALYANGPVMTQLDGYGYGGFLVLKKENNEPLKEALTLWKIHRRCEIGENPDRKEQVEFWDVDDVETLDTYTGKVRVIRAVVTKPDQDPSTWCFAIIGKRAPTRSPDGATDHPGSMAHRGYGLPSMDPILEFRACFSTQLERLDGRPAPLDVGLQLSIGSKQDFLGLVRPRSVRCEY